MFIDGVVESLVEFTIYRKYYNKHKKSAYVKAGNLLFTVFVLIRFTTILIINFLVFSGIYRKLISYFSKDENPNNEFNSQPVMADLSFNLMMDSMVLTEFIVW